MPVLRIRQRLRQIFFERFAALVAVLLMCLPWQALHALDLMQSWQLVQSHDPRLAAAQQEHVAGQTHARQADSLWRPSLIARGVAGRAAQDSRSRGARFSAPGFAQLDGADFRNSTDNGTQTEYGLQLRQPLIDGQRTAQAHELRHSAEAAQAFWDDARQLAMLRLAQRYFDVLLAEHQRRVLQAQQESVKGLLQRAEARFSAGDASILDVHEARSRLGQIDNQIQLAETRLALARRAFGDITGHAAQDLQTLSSDTSRLTAGANLSLADYLAQAEQASPQLRQSLAQAAMAADRADGLRAIAQPRLSLIGEAGRSHLSGSGRYGSVSQSANQWSVGLELQIPLYTGGLRSARYREALARRDGARQQVLVDRQQLALLAETAWLGLETGATRMAALEHSLQASEARRDAMRLGLELGERTMLDWLDAEQSHAMSQLEIHRTLVDLAMQRLQLHAYAGLLNESVLAELNCSLSGVLCPEPALSVNKAP